MLVAHLSQSSEGFLGPLQLLLWGERLIGVLLGLVWWTEFRAGNVSPSSGAMEVLKTILHKVPKQLSVSLRVDSAWYQVEVMDYCNEYKKNKVQPLNKKSMR